MSTNPYDHGYVEAVVQLPRMGKLLRFRVTISEYLAECFERLPRCRELAFLPEEGRRAAEQQAKRREMASIVAKTLTDSILKAVESDDTIQGYEPGELVRTTQPPDFGGPLGLGYLAKDPLKLDDWVDYENVLVGCAYCGARMPHAPFPTNSDYWAHRPRCGKCGSPGTYPIRNEDQQSSQTPPDEG